MRVTKLRKMLSKQRSDKDTQDHEYEEQFRQKNTPRMKKRQHKKPRGDYYGRYWFPHND